MTNTVNINIPPLETDNVSIRIVGCAPIVQHKWSEKAKKMMRDKHNGVKTKTRDVRDPQGEFEAAMYVGKNTGLYGFPVSAMVGCLVNTAHNNMGIAKNMLSKVIRFTHQDYDVTENVPLILFDKTDDPIMREDPVRVGMGSADLRYRPQFNNWSAILEIQLDTTQLPVEQFLKLLQRAGFGVGLQEMRPQKGGDFGTFDIDMTYGVQMIKNEVVEVKKAS